MEFNVNRLDFAQNLCCSNSSVYGCENWILTKDILKTLEEFQEELEDPQTLSMLFYNGHL